MSLTPALAAAFEAVTIDYGAVLPLLVVVVGAIAGVLIESFAPRSARYTAQVITTLVTLLVAFVLLVTVSTEHLTKTLGGSVVIDGPALFMQGTLLLLGFIAVLVIAERFGGVGADAFTPMGASTPGSPYEAAAERAGLATSEVFPLTLISIAGMLMFTASADLIAMFVALEVVSLPLYVLTGLARRRRLLSQEASLKYFLLGAFSSSFFIFGAALIYGYAGSVDFDQIAAAVANSSGALEGLILPGVLLVFVGLLFKIGAVPFHPWTPDAYQGAPTPITGFMAAGTKLAAFGAILRFGYVAVEANRWDWQMGLIVVAILTMVVGAVFSVTQTDMKRLLAYSSIAHAGFILVGVLAFSARGIAGVMFYLVAYGFMTIAAFAIVAMVRQGASEASHLSQWAGLGRRHPVVAGIYSFLLLAFTGVPLTSGFTAKYAAFAPAVETGGQWGVILVVIGVLASAITAFVYIKIIVLMYFTEPTTDDVTALSPSILTMGAVTIGTAVTVILGVVPGPVLELAVRASEFIR